MPEGQVEKQVVSFGRLHGELAQQQLPIKDQFQTKTQRKPEPGKKSQTQVFQGDNSTRDDGTNSSGGGASQPRSSVVLQLAPNQAPTSPRDWHEWCTRSSLSLPCV
jgi:hypothetical protein